MKKHQQRAEKTVIPLPAPDAGRTVTGAKAECKALDK
jgi:hypothetical protein